MGRVTAFSSFTVRRAASDKGAAAHTRRPDVPYGSGYAAEATTLNAQQFPVAETVTDSGRRIVHHHTTLTNVELNYTSRNQTNYYSRNDPEDEDLRMLKKLVGGVILIVLLGVLLWYFLADEDLSEDCSAGFSRQLLSSSSYDDICRKNGDAYDFCCRDNWEDPIRWRLSLDPEINYKANCRTDRDYSRFYNNRCRDWCGCGQPDVSFSDSLKCDKCCYHDQDAGLCYRADPGSSSSSGCLGGNNPVRMQDGGLKRVRNLSIGDQIEVGEGVFEPVLALPAHSSWAFGFGSHKQIASFLQFHTGNGASFYVTPDHLVPEATTGRLLQAQDLKVGHHRIFLGGSNETTMIAERQLIRDQGVYLPLTPSCILLVDGIRVSCASAETFREDTLRMVMQVFHLMWSTLPTSVYAALHEAVFVWTYSVLRYYPVLGTFLVVTIPCSTRVPSLHMLRKITA